jgi:DNA modification methylase
MNTLYFGDNLDIMREHLKDNSVDLIYLDPPFNSKRAYNVYMVSQKGAQSDAQITAFEDTWHWGEQAEEEYMGLLRQPNTDVSEMIISLRRYLKESDMMAYLVMMAARFLEMHRVLRETGSLYLHCDPTASHYLKIVLDTIFGATNFRNEIIWQRINAKGNVQRKFGSVHDIIFAYAKNLGKEVWNQQYRPLDKNYVETMYRYIEKETGRKYRIGDLTAPASRASKGQIYDWKGYKLGSSRVWTYAKEKMQELEDAGRIIYSDSGYPNFKRYLDENPGEKIPDVWTDIPPALGKEALGYPTQKPLVLLERIIESSSNKGDVVLDPFCGCGTMVHAAQKIGREWIGIDITHLAISLIEKRLKDAFPGIKYEVYGTPKSLASAKDLADRNKYQFQWWACSLVNAQPYQGKRKGADGGTDGIIFFQDDNTGAKKIIVSVKGGESVTRTMIADLKNTVERENAQIGLFITLAEPTGPMKTEAVSAGYYVNSYDEQFPKIQILTIEELLNGKKPHYRDLSLGGSSFKKAKVEEKEAKQNGFF